MPAEGVAFVTHAPGGDKLAPSAFPKSAIMRETVTARSIDNPFVTSARSCAPNALILVPPRNGATRGNTHNCCLIQFDSNQEFPFLQRPQGKGWKG